MSSVVEYALLAGAAYFDTRSAINRILLPIDWSVYSRFPEDKATGFEASAYKKGAEIVISYAGTYDKSLPDIVADAGLATGVGSAQLLQAVEYYLQIKAANPGATIKLKGSA